MTKKIPLVVIVGSVIIFTTFTLFIHAQKVSHLTTSPFFDKYHDLWFWLVLNMGVVFFWRGSWGLLDLIVFPKDLKKSYGVSLAIGAFLLGIAYALGHTDFSI